MLDRRIFLSVLTSSIVFALYLSREDIEMGVKSFSLAPPPALIGPLAVNNVLAHAERLLEGQVTGPESIVIDGDALYTTSQDGRVLKVVGDTIVKEYRISTEKKGDALDREHIRGRPLGMRKMPGPGARLLVTDAHLGVFEVDMDRETHKILLDASKPVGGARPRFLNDVEILNNDEILVTDSSTKYERRDFMREVVESAPYGRVIHHCLSTGQSRVLLDGLHFANGIQILPDRHSFVVAELTRSRLTRYWLEGPKAGSTEPFAENLPGIVDNVRMSKNGTLWVGLASVRYAGLFTWLEWMSNKPFVRNAILKTIPPSLLPPIVFRLLPNHAIIVELDLTGRIVSSLHDPKGQKIKSVSEIADAGEYLYLGSFDAPYLARVQKPLHNL